MTATENEQHAPAGREYVRIVALAAAIGIPAAFAAALFLALVHDLEHWLWTDLPDSLGHSEPPWYLVLGLPVVGAALVVVARRFLPGDGGIPPLVGLSDKPTPVRNAPGIVLAALGTLAFGAVLGPEAPVVAIGSVVGLAATYLMRVGRQEGNLLASAGSFSAVSALFGGPIVGGVMMVESGVALGSAVIPALLPGFVAAAVGYVIFVGFGDWGGLATPGLVVPSLPLYDGTHVFDLGVAVVVGVATTLTISVVRHSSYRLLDEGTKRLTMPVFMLGGGLAIGAIALLADGLGADSQDVLFSGQASIPSLISEGSTTVVLVLLAAKAIAYVVSLASGFRGGSIFPAVFLGIGLATLPVVWFDMSPTVAIAIGAAAGMAAQTRLLLTSILFGALLVGGQGADAVPAAVLAAASAWMTISGLGAHRRAVAWAEPATH